MNTKPRAPRFIWIALGLLLLLGSAIGARYVLTNGHDSPGNASAGEAPIPPNVTALGLVDSPTGVVTLGKPGEVVWVIEEGAEVKKDAVLLKLDRRAAEHLLEQAEADLEAAQEQVREAQVALDAYQPKIDQQKTAIAIAEKTFAIAKEEYSMAKKNSENIAVEKVKVAELAQDKAELAVKLEQKRERELQKAKPILEAKVRRAQALERAKAAQVKSAQFGLDETDVKAPSDGVVLRVQTSAGEVITTSSRVPPIQFCPQEDPKKDRIIRAEVLQEWAGRVATGQEVLIANDPRSDAKWTGRVKSISKWVAPKRHIWIEPFIVNDVRTLECIIEVTAGDAPLLIGQRVRVSFLDKK